MSRVRALILLAVTVAALGAALVVNATAAPGAVAVAAQPPPPPPVLPPGDGCPPGSPLPVCQFPAPTTTPPLTGLPLPIPTAPTTAVTCFPGSWQHECLHPTTPPPAPPCTGEGCIPQPPTTPPPGGPGGGQPGPGQEPADECGISDIGACISEAIDAFFRGIVTAGLNPLLDLLAKSLLTTPTLDSLPRVGELWHNSWQILLAAYGLLILIAGVLVMAYESLQTRHSIKEIAPRLVLGFLSGALSLWVATKAIAIANGLSQAVMGGGVDAAAASETLRNLVLSSLNGGLFIIFIGIFLIGMLIVLLVTYVVRVALTIILIAGGPLALMFHALPQTEGIAKWWWKALGGLRAIQIGQSLVLIAAMKVFLAPGGFTLFGPTMSGLVNLLVSLALMYILFKIPGWILGSLRNGSGRSAAGSILRGVIAYKAFGLLGARASRGGRRGGAGRRPGTPGGGQTHSGGGGSAAPNPYARTRATAGGQYLLPLTGIRRTRPTNTPRPTRTASAPQSAAGHQFALPLGADWPENTPRLGRDGQYRLALDIARVTPTPSPTTPPIQGGPRSRTGRQLPLPFDPYRGIRPTRTGQYPLPLDGLHRTPRPPDTPLPPAAPPSAVSRGRGTQMPLPFDPYKGNRATRTGQYPLPLDSVRRTPAPKPAPPAPVRRPSRPPASRQLRLPLDLPKPARRTPPPAPPRRDTGGTT